MIDDGLTTTRHLRKGQWIYVNDGPIDSWVEVLGKDPRTDGSIDITFRYRNADGQAAVGERRMSPPFTDYLLPVCREELD